MKTFKTRTAVHFIFSLKIFVSANVIIMSITALCMFTNLFLVVLMLFADLPIPKFHFQLQKKRLGKSSGKGQTSYNLEDGVTALDQLFALYSHRARSFSQ